MVKLEDEFKDEFGKFDDFKDEMDELLSWRMSWVSLMS